MKKTLSAAWPSLLLASLLLLPWLHKAHSTDDTTFLLMAEQVLKDPLHPTAFEMMADGNWIRLSSQLVSGPVMAYLLVPAILLGGAEWAAHLVQYFLVTAAIMATVSLCFRLGLDAKCARLAGLLLASTPAAMVMATTGMADVPAMSFAVLAMERFVAWRQDSRWHQCILSAGFFALAALSRPHLILMPAVAAALQCAGHLPAFRNAVQKPAGGRARRSFTLRQLLPVFLALMLILIATHLTVDPMHAGNNFLRASLSRFRPVNAAANLAAFGSHWILVFPLGLLWLSRGIRWQSLWRNPALWLAAAAACSVWILGRSDNKVPGYAAAIAFAGFAVILDVLFDAYRRRDPVQLFLWVWLLIALPAVAYVQLPCKYLIPAAPAAAILPAALLHRLRIPGLLRCTAIAAGIILTLLICASDAQFAGAGRRIAAEQIAPRTGHGDRVWINGEWGFEWYAMKAGAIPLSKQPPHPVPGDVIVSCSTAPHLSPGAFPNAKPVDSIAVVSRFGRIMSRPAGFYSNGYGLLPWIWSNGEMERFTILKMP